MNYEGYNGPLPKGHIMNVVATTLRVLAAFLAAVFTIVIFQMMLMQRVTMAWMLFFGKTAKTDPSN